MSCNIILKSTYSNCVKNVNVQVKFPQICCYCWVDIRILNNYITDRAACYSVARVDIRILNNYTPDRAACYSVARVDIRILNNNTPDRATCYSVARVDIRILNNNTLYLTKLPAIV